MDGLHGDASQNDDAKGKIQFYHETLEDTTLRLYNIERDLQNSVQKCMYNMNCTINFKVLFIFLFSSAELHISEQNDLGTWQTPPEGITPKTRTLSDFQY